MNKVVAGLGAFVVVLGITLTVCSLIEVPFTETQLVDIPHSEEHFNTNIDVPPGHYYQSAGLTQFHKIHIDFTVTSGGNRDIDFFVADEVNYYKWKSGETASTYLSKDRITSFDTEWKGPKTDTWYFVYDNSFSWITHKQISTIITENWTTMQDQDVTTYRTLLPSLFSYIGIILLVVGAGILITGLIYSTQPPGEKTDLP